MDPRTVEPLFPQASHIISIQPQVVLLKVYGAQFFCLAKSLGFCGIRIQSSTVSAIVGSDDCIKGQMPGAMANWCWSLKSSTNPMIDRSLSLPNFILWFVGWDLLCESGAVCTNPFLYRKQLHDAAESLKVYDKATSLPYCLPRLLNWWTDTDKQTCLVT